MKDLFEAINTRVKEPYWGFFLLSFLAFNWKGVFLLCFSVGTAQERINLFESLTSIWSLVLWPVTTAIFILLITPWLKLLFGWVSSSAYERLNSQDLKREHKYLAEKNSLEKERAIALADKESELIEQAKRDEDIDKIEDEKLKENLKREIDELRKNRNELVHNKTSIENQNQKELSAFQKKVLNEIFQSKDGCIQKKIINGYKFVLLDENQISESGNSPEYFRYVDSINILVKHGLLKDLNNEGRIFELTSTGKNLIVSINDLNSSTLQPTQ